jgi:hypothetical protein
MGAWGLGLFDNDDAADWSSALDDSDDALGFVSETFDVVDEADGYLDGPDANNAIAAIAWLVSRLPGTPVAESAYAPETAAPVEVAAVRLLADRAVAVLGRVLGEDSEWRELWAEAGEKAPAAEVERLRAFVAGL